MACRVRISASTPTITTGRSRCTRTPGSTRSPAAPPGGSRSHARSHAHEHGRVAAGHRPPVRARRSTASSSAMRTDDDWAAMADTSNAARAGDGVDEVRTDGEPPRRVRAPRRRSARSATWSWRSSTGGWWATPWACSSSARACSSARCGARSGPRTGTRASARRCGAPTATGWPRRQRRIPGPGPRELRSYALDIEAADLALIADQGYVPIRYGFEMRRFLTGSLPEHPLPDGPRAAARRARRTTGRSGRRTPRRSAITGATASRPRATSSRASRPRRRTPPCGRSRGTATRWPDP